MTMNQPNNIQPQNSFKVTSNYFIQQIDSLIVQLAKAFAIEYSIKPDPDAKEMVRRVLLSRVHNLMSEQSEQFVAYVVDATQMQIKELKNEDLKRLAKEKYELIKLMGLENVKST
jgi:hypothetical protein